MIPKSTPTTRLKALISMLSIAKLHRISEGYDCDIKGVNPRWVAGTAIEILYDKCEINEQRMQRLREDIGL